MDVVPVAPGEGDALPFISSNALTAAVGCLALSGLEGLVGVTEEVSGVRLARACR